MENSLKPNTASDVVISEQITPENRLEIIDEGVRKKYLARLSEMPIAPIGNLPPLESDVISNVRLYHITEMVYQKGEPVTDKFTTVFNTLSLSNTASICPGSISPLSSLPFMLSSNSSSSASKVPHSLWGSSRNRMVFFLSK